MKVLVGRYHHDRDKRRARALLNVRPSAPEAEVLDSYSALVADNEARRRHASAADVGAIHHERSELDSAAELLLGRIPKLPGRHVEGVGASALPSISVGPEADQPVRQEATEERTREPATQSNSSISVASEEMPESEKISAATFQPQALELSETQVVTESGAPAQQHTQKPLVVLLTTITIGLVIAGVSALNALKKADVATERAARLERDLEQARKDLDAERAKRRQLAEKIPFILTGMRFRNERMDGTPIGDFATRFPMGEVRYISFYVDVRSDLAEFQPVVTNIGVKYIRPDGSLDQNSSSPEKFTFILSKVEIIDGGTVSFGWGNDSQASFSAGQYRVQLWSKGKMVAEGKFVVG